MKIIHLVLGKANPERMNGVNQVAHSLATHQKRLGYDVELWGITATHKDLPSDREYGVRLFKSRRIRFAVGREFSEAVANLEMGTVFHIHGGFIPQFYTASRYLVT